MPWYQTASCVWQEGRRIIEPVAVDTRWLVNVQAELSPSPLVHELKEDVRHGPSTALTLHGVAAKPGDVILQGELQRSQRSCSQDCGEKSYSRGSASCVLTNCRRYTSYDGTAPEARGHGPSVTCAGLSPRPSTKPTEPSAGLDGN
ncbi:unnamed protein product [Boreogadus saida]